MAWLTDILILLAAAVIAVPLFQSLRLGAIPGFLVAGVVLGPSVLGYIENPDEIAHLAELGVVLLLFVIGIEINPSRLWKMKGLVLGLGSLQVLITGAVITLISQALLDVSWRIAVLIGLALALSSTAFVLQLLTEKKMLYTEYGRPAVAVLLLQDLAVVPLLAFVALLATPETGVSEGIGVALAEALVILTLIVLTARYMLNPILKLLARYGSPEIFTASALLLVLGSAHAMESIGLSMAMGAFVAGLLIADSSYRHQIIAEIEPFRGLLLGLFFMTMGMAINLELFRDAPLSILGVVAGLMLVKFLVLWPLSRLFRIRTRSAAAVALVLAQSGEFALVLFALARGAGLMDDTLFQQLLLIVMLSMLATPALDKFALRIFASDGSDIAAAPETTADENRTARPAIILAGFGRMGKRIGAILDSLHIPYAAIDNNPAVVERERAEGRAVYFGDARRPEVLRAAGIASAPLAIVAIDAQDAAEHVVATLHSAFPAVPVFARGHDLIACHELHALGAHYTVSETLEASAELARAALLHLGTDADAVDHALDDFRKHYYDRIHPEHPAAGGA